MESGENTKDGNGQREQSFSTTLEAGSQFICTRENSLVIPDAGATASRVCLRWLNHHNSMLGKVGLPRVSTFPAQVHYKFGGGWMGGVQFATYITVCTAGAMGNSAAFVLDAGIPAILRKEESGALGGG